MLARVRVLQARVLPRGWLDALRQVSLFVGAFLAYRLVRGLVEGEANQAFAHARDLISLERGMHVFVEPSIQTWASGSHAVAKSLKSFSHCPTSVWCGAVRALLSASRFAISFFCCA